MESGLSEELMERFPYFRQIAQDGNSYYRAVYIFYLEMLIGLNDDGRAASTLAAKIEKGSGYFFSSAKNKLF